MYTEEKFDWNYVYGKVEEELPYNMPKAKGREVIITMFADTIYTIIKSLEDQSLDYL